MNFKSTQRHHPEDIIDRFLNEFINIIIILYLIKFCKSNGKNSRSIVYLRIDLAKQAYLALYGLNYRAKNWGTQKENKSLPRKNWGYGNQDFSQVSNN